LGILASGMKEPAGNFDPTQLANHIPIRLIQGQYQNRQRRQTSFQIFLTRLE
jgi:hypothetical protein